MKRLKKPIAIATWKHGYKGTLKAEEILKNQKRDIRATKTTKTKEQQRSKRNKIGMDAHKKKKTTIFFLFLIVFILYLI